MANSRQPRKSMPCLTVGSWTTLILLCVFCAAVVIALPAQTLTTVVNLDPTTGFNPTSPVTQGTDGNFYGTTTRGGTKGYGTIFKLTPGGILTPLYNFCSQSNCTDGLSELSGAALMQASNGDFYGTTAQGGRGDDNCNSGCGTLFKITQGGTFTTLYSFCSQPNCTDGAYPQGLVQASDGNIYGTTSFGGAHNGAGTVFKITLAGTLTTLYNFCSQPNCADGGSPFGGKVAH